MALSSRTAGLPGATGRAPVGGPSDDYEEISLVDIVRVVYRRRLLLAGTLALALVAGGALTVLTTPQYESKTTIIPLAHADLVKSWLESRQAAEVVATKVGGPLNAALFPNEWDAARSQWKGTPPSAEELSLRLTSHVRVTPIKGLQTNSQIIAVNVKLPNAVLARDVADGYLASLDELRPQLENITRSELFDSYYDGTNGQEAQHRAEIAAQQKAYWLVFDSATVPSSASEPRPVLNMALAGALGVALGLVLVFTVEWLSRYRADFARVDPPPR